MQILELSETMGTYGGKRPQALNLKGLCHEMNILCKLMIINRFFLYTGCDKLILAHFLQPV